MIKLFLDIQTFLKLTSCVLVVSLTACGKSEKTPEIIFDKAQTAFIPTKLVQQEDKVFALDSLTNFISLEGKLANINQREVFHFMNYENPKIYFYDYETGQRLNTIILKKEGPHMVQIPSIMTDYFVHNMDSVFISTNLLNRALYLVNQGSEVLFKTGFGHKIGSRNPNIWKEKALHFTDYSTYRQGVLTSGIRVAIPEPDQQNPLRTHFDLATERFENLFLEEAKIVPHYKELQELMRQKQSVNIQKFVVGNGDTVFASSQISDSIYEFQKGTFIKAHYAANPAITTADYKTFNERASIESEPGSVNKITKDQQPPYFLTMFMDVEKKWIYRILLHHTSRKKIPGSDFEPIIVDEASVIAFNVERKKSYVVDLPKELHLYLTVKGVFANKNGIHFPVKDQELENEKRYNVYQLN